MFSLLDFGLLEFLLFFGKVDYHIKLGDKNMMQRTGNRRDLTYLFAFTLDAHEKGSSDISLLLCIHPPSLLKQCSYLKITTDHSFSPLSLNLLRILLHYSFPVSLTRNNFVQQQL